MEVLLDAGSAGLGLTRGIWGGVANFLDSNDSIVAIPSGSSKHSFGCARVGTKIGLGGFRTLQGASVRVLGTL